MESRHDFRGLTECNIFSINKVDLSFSTNRHFDETNLITNNVIYYQSVKPRKSCQNREVPEPRSIVCARIGPSASEARRLPVRRGLVSRLSSPAVRPHKAESSKIAGGESGCGFGPAGVDLAKRIDFAFAANLCEARRPEVTLDSSRTQRGAGLAHNLVRRTGRFKRRSIPRCPTAPEAPRRY